MGKRVWIEGQEFREIARMAEEKGWSDEELAKYLERRYGKPRNELHD